MLSGSPARRSGPDSGTGPCADRIRAQVAQDAGDPLLGGRLDQTSGDHLLKNPITPGDVPRPRRVQAPCRTCHSSVERWTPPRGAGQACVPAPAFRDSRSRSPWLCSAAIFCRPASSRAADSAASWTEPRCFTIQRTPFVLDRDLYHRGPRGGPDPAQAGAHTSAPYGLLAPHARLTPPQYQRKSPLAHPQSGKASGVRTDSHSSTLPTPWRHPQPVNSIYAKTSYLIYERWTTEFIKWCRHRSFRVAPVVLY